MDLKGKVVFLTGASSGIGSALLLALLQKRASKVYAAARSVEAAKSHAKFDPVRIVPVQLDITDSEQVGAAAEQCRDVDLLINNAGINRGMWLTGPTAMEYAREEMEVNFFGTLAMCRAFAPGLISRGGTMVNVCSLLGLVNLPLNGTYCASKAAGHSLLQGMRGELTPKGVRVVGVYPGPLDTRMTAALLTPRATPWQVASAILAGLESGEEYIYPDPMSRDIRILLELDARHVEKSFAMLASPR